ncbi:Centrosomal protein of 162 kDa [Trichoplax sp. H2]|nr:Centrosomal protein of 162 kDa [Trichoplax sp. H2]|eukprot:RDD39225.1 Centrosomal protein of 162 kDa [Trichoplax sp. H2]
MALSDEEFNRDLQDILGGDASSDSSAGLHFGTSQKNKTDKGKRKNKKANVSLPSWYSGGTAMDETDDTTSDNDNADDWFTTEPSKNMQSLTSKQAVTRVDDSNTDLLVDDHATTDPSHDSKNQPTVTVDDSRISINRNNKELGGSAGDQDTLKEMEEKKELFNRLQKNYGDNVPYANLCDQLENSDNMTSISSKNKSATVDANSDENKDVTDWTVNDQLQDPTTNSEPLQSQSNNATLEKNNNYPIKPSMLSKVSLADTLDSTLQQTIKDDNDVFEDSIKLGTVNSAINTKSGATSDLDAIKKLIENAGLTGDDETLSTTNFIDNNTDNNNKNAENVAPLLPEQPKNDTDIHSGETLPVFNHPTTNDAVTIFDKSRQESENLVRNNDDNETNDEIADGQSKLSLPTKGLQNVSHKQEQSTPDQVAEPRGFDLQLVATESEDERIPIKSQVDNVNEQRGFDLQAIETDSDSNISVTKSASMEKKLRAAREKFKNSSDQYKPKSSSYSPAANTPVSSTKNFIERNKIIAKKRDPRTQHGNTPRKEPHSTPVKKTPNRNAPKGSSNIPVSIQNRDAQLIAASVESFANYIQDVVGKTTKISASPQMESSKNDESTKWKDAWMEEKNKVEKLIEDFKVRESSWAQQQRELELTMEKKMHDVKQDNFILLAKIREYEEQLNARKRVIGGGGLEGSTNNELKTLEKDIKDQESLLKGYQTENERLYEELKLTRNRSKAIEKKMYTENEQLKVEIMSLKNKLEAVGFDPVQKTNPIILGAGKIAELESELKASKERELNLRQEVDQLEVIKGELEKHIDKLVRELNEYKSHIEEGKMITAENLSELKERYEKELSDMREKLKWYAENQQLLDHDSNEIKEKRLQIKELNQQVEELKKKAATEIQESELYTSQRQLYEQQIKDHKRQIREMDEIIKRRYPNSISALIYAANASSGNEPSVDNESKSPHSAIYLENELQKLKEELKEKEIENEKSIRSLKQLNEGMKIKYDDRVTDLETQLATATDRLSRLTGEYHQRSVHPYTRTQALEKELESLKERHKQRDAQMLKDITTAVESLSNVTTSSASPGVDEAIIALKDDNLEINAERPTKDQLEVIVKKLLEITKLKIADIKDIKSQNGRLKSTKEIKRKKTDIRKTPKKSIQIMQNIAAPENQKAAVQSNQEDKNYNPRYLLESELADVSNEKNALENQIANLKLEYESDVKSLHDQIHQERSLLENTRKDLLVQMEEMKEKHMEEFRIYVNQHSEINLSEKNAKIESQKLLIEELRRKLTDANKVVKTVDIYQQREVSLKDSVAELKEELTLIKDVSNPDLRHFSFLLSKVNQLEKKYKERENELKNMINFSNGMSEFDVNEREEKWQRILLAKNEQINYFRQELDNMMEVLSKIRAQQKSLTSLGDQW